MEEPQILSSAEVEHSMVPPSICRSNQHRRGNNEEDVENTHTTPSARRCTKTCPPGITLGSVSPFNSFTTHVKSERAPGVKQRLKITCDSGMATSARIDAAAFFCHSSDSNVAMARTRICRRAFVGVSSHAGNARWAASIAARQSSEDADAAMEARTPV